MLSLSFFFTAHELNWTCVNSRNGMRVVRGSISCDPIQPISWQTQPNPTQYSWQWSLQFGSDYFYTQNYLVLLVNQASTYSCSLLIVL